MKKTATIDAQVLESRLLNNAGTYLLTLAVTEEFVRQAKPGMFSAFMPKSAHVHGRPFSIVSAGDISRSEDTSPKLAARFIVKDRGPNSHHFTHLKSGQNITITYPRGQAIKIGNKVNHYILVAGNIGLAALIFLAEKLLSRGKRVTIFEGAKTKMDLISEWYFTNKLKWNVKSIAENGQSGVKTGFVTDLLREELENISESAEVVACGPLPMMHAVAEMCAAKSVPCQIILESVFACNQGACLGCAVMMADGTTRHICKDGPAFYTSELDWEKLMKSHLTPEHSKPTLACNLEVVLIGYREKKLKLDSPVIGASGTQSLYSLTKGYTNISKLGAILTKGLTLEPRTGNPGPRVCETASGMLNSIGLENIGLKAFSAEELPKLLSLGKPVIANINGSSIKEYAQLAKALNQTDIAAMEVNISCPNVKQGGMAFGVDPHLTYEVVKEVREATDKLLIVKLTPNVTDIVAIAKAAVAAGADAISAINTVSGMAIDIASRRPKLGNLTGGLSGPAIKPIGVKLVRDLANAKLSVPIIGVGGIADANDALEYLIAGASAVQIGTAGFTDEEVFTKVARGIREYMLRNGFYDMYSLTNSLII